MADAIALRHQPFRYEPLFNASANIRLLTIATSSDNETIACTLTQATFHHPYTCLSYRWGPDVDHRTIFVNHEPFLVRPSLYAFLQTARQHGLRQPIWIDAICINQQDSAEKSCQVRLMGHIYSQAIRTIVWLGLSEEDCAALGKLEHFMMSLPESSEIKAWRTAFAADGQLTAPNSERDVLDKINKGLPVTRDELASSAVSVLAPGDPPSLLTSEGFSDAWTGLMSHWHRVTSHNGLLVRFASSEYWTRTWIVQELMLSRKIEILCLMHHIRVQELLTLSINIIYYLRSELRRQGDDDEALLKVQQTIFSITRQLRPSTLTQKLAEHGPQKVHFAEAIRLTVGRGCWDVRDRVFSIVSLIRSGDTFKVDYDQTPIELLAYVLNFHIGYQGEDLVIRRVLPALMERTAITLEVIPPPLDELPDISTFLASLINWSNIRPKPFWAKLASHSGARLDSPSNFSCSFCVAAEIGGRQGVLEIWWSQLGSETACSKDAFWWYRRDGHWTSKVAGTFVEDLD